MSKSRYSEQSNEELLKIRKIARIITSMLAVAILALFLLSLYNSKRGYSLIAVPLALSAIVMLNIINIREISKELKLRSID